MSHIAQRPLIVGLDAVSVPGVAQETGNLATLERISIQLETLIKLQCQTNFILGSISGISIEPEAAYMASGL
jgi:hypothetical protein